jgi:SOS-response transcriptional repressor LexA
VPEEEVLIWLALGAVARKEGRSLVRPVVHAFVRGVSGAAVTFPRGISGPKLWLSAEDEQASRASETRARFPVLSCTTCGQHYFEHHLEDFEFSQAGPGGGHAVVEGRVWRPLDGALGGKRLLVIDHVVGSEEDEAESPRLAEIFLCRSCGAAHPADRGTCDGCGLQGPLVRLFAVQQRQDQPGRLARCISCGALGRLWGSGYKEPARPVRAVAVADVHVLAQDMIHYAELRRLLVFADNRQDAAFQAGWMRDHSRRFRMRALMADRIRQGSVSIGDLTAHLDDVLEKDDELSRVLIPEVWQIYRKEAEGLRHAQERKRFLRIQILRELTIRIKQSIGLEPWGRLRVQYSGLLPEASFIVQKADELRVPSSDLAEGIGALLDLMRRQNQILYDRDGEIFSRFWREGDLEIQRGYMTRVPSVPQGVKFKRGPGDDKDRIIQWASETGHLTIARQVARSWGVKEEDTDSFLEALWKFLTNELKLLVPVTLRGSRGRALPGCSGAYQIDADKIRLAPIRELYCCKKCRRAQVRRTPRNRCMGWRCDGELEFEPENKDSYDLAILDGGFQMIRPREHSAQVPPEERDEMERLFKGTGEALNTLVCTPTLELGVDIGQLDTILLRNVPPLPSNYWQRVGRAGRRHRMAVNITYARPASHDQVYFADPQKMIEGAVEPPKFNMRNDLMVRKHAHATILTWLRKLARRKGGAEQQEIESTLSQMFPTQIKSYLFDENGNVRVSEFNLSPLQQLISKYESDLVSHVLETFNQGWPEVDAVAVEGETLIAYVREASSELASVIQRFQKRLNWALDQLNRLAAERQRRGTLDPAEDALFTRCDNLVKRLKGQAQRRRLDVEGFDDTNTFAALAAEGFLPGYGLDIGAVLGTAQMPRYLANGRDFDLRRPTTIALREYVPGNLLYANGQRFVPRYYHLEPERPTYFRVDVAHEAVNEVGTPLQGNGQSAAQTAALGSAQLRAVPMCDVDLPHFSHINDDEEFRFQMSVLVLGYEKQRWSGGQAYSWGSRDLLHRRGVHIRLVNIGAKRLLDNAEPKLGFPLCLVCGQSRSPFASDAEREHFATDHLQRCGKPVEPSGFYADVVADALSLPGSQDREEAYSVLETIRTGAAQVLDMETEDLELLVMGRAGTDQVDALLYDPMPGGSGLLDQICARFDEVVTAALDIAENCPSDCARGCVDCLYRFRNAVFHRFLNRRLAADRLRSWGTRLEPSHPIPSRMPQAESERRQGMPVNVAETLLRAMISNAGLPTGEWHHRIDLGRPLNGTEPDIYYQDDDPSAPGICVYLDGLSGHIHGNPETFQRDRQIREQLRAGGYEVLEIAASDLYDREKMTRHFFRLGRLLVGREEAQRIRQKNDWFVHPESSNEAGETRKANILPFKKVEGKPEEQFRSCVPLMSLKAAAGGFGETVDVQPEAWVEPNTNRKLDRGMFVAQVVGHSMEPLIPDGSYCLFRSPVVGSRNGRIVLVQHHEIHDPESGGSYTIKKYESEKILSEDGSWRHTQIKLEPINPAFTPISLNEKSEGEVRVIAEFVEVLNVSE